MNLEIVFKSGCCQYTQKECKKNWNGKFSVCKICFSSLFSLVRKLFHHDRYHRNERHQKSKHRRMTVFKTIYDNAVVGGQV
jgi:hypothetical protein